MKYKVFSLLVITAIIMPCGWGMQREAAVQQQSQQAPPVSMSQFFRISPAVDNSVLSRSILLAKDYMRDGRCMPLTFDRDLIAYVYRKMYNEEKKEACEHQLLLAKMCAECPIHNDIDQATSINAVGGLFCYLDCWTSASKKSHLSYAPLNEASGSWCALLNVLNTIKLYLFHTRGISSFRDQADMSSVPLDTHDIHALTSFKDCTKLELSDYGELFLRFVSTHYNTADANIILNEIGFRCFCVFKNKRDSRNRDQFFDTIFRRQKENVGFTFLNKYFAILNSDLRNNLFFTEETKTPWSSTLLDPTSPYKFPLLVDNGKQVSNIYGMHDRLSPKHFFVGETSHKETHNPWAESGWRTYQEVFGNSDMHLLMIFFVRESYEADGWVEKDFTPLITMAKEFKLEQAKVYQKPSQRPSMWAALEEDPRWCSIG